MAFTRSVAGLGIVLAAAAAVNVQAADVTSCGQVVHGSGDLRADLDCAAHTGSRAVQLIGKLRLNGFSITGGATAAVVYCNTGPCIIEGPGRLRGGETGVLSDVGAKLDRVSVELNAGDGIYAQRSVRVLGDATISDNGGNGVRSQRGPITVVGGTGPSSNAVVSGNGGNGIVTSRTVRVQAAQVTGNDQDGIRADGAVSVALSAVQGNGLDGVQALRVRLRDSVATANRTDPTCLSNDVCADVASGMKPALAGSSACETSRKVPGPGTWLACALD
jgi:hypothetical protein